MLYQPVEQYRAIMALLFLFSIILLSADAFKLDQSKILLYGNGLNLTAV